MKIGSVCTRLPETISPLDTVRLAAELMSDKDVGALIVADISSEPLGMLTDRDIVTRCVAEGLSPNDTPVSDVMTTNVTQVFHDAEVETALAAMADAEVRRLVVVDDAGRVTGIVTLDDLLSGIVDQTDEIGRLLRGQVHV